MFFESLFFLVCLCVDQFGEAISEYPPIIEVHYEQGIIVGLRREVGGDSRPFYTFKGIPYALPPVGDLRLKPPIGDVKWDGVRDGNWEPHVCTQFIDSVLMGEEDCLYLNVFTPKPGDFGYPVIVFIHGGDFINGGALEYPPLPFLKRDVVLVVLQYRLGMLGFLSTDDVEVPGNLGLRDQTKALVWVNKYIKEFGGDPNKVTLLGMGSGAASVHYQILTPYAKGLFSRAIMQSGSSFCPSMFHSHRYSFSVSELLHEFNCQPQEIAGQSSPHSSVLLDCLQKMPLKEFASLYRDYFEWHMLPILTLPRVDGDYIPDHPVVLLREGRYNKVDIIVGFNQHDGTIISANLYYYPYLMKSFRNKFLSIGAILMALNEEENAAQLAGIAYHKLIGAKNINEPEGAEALTKLFTDRLFSVPINDMLSLHAETSPQNNLFYYRLTHRGKFSFCSFFNIPYGNNWVCNGDDMTYLFEHEGTFSDDLPLQNIIFTLWNNFIAHGNPTPDESLGFLWNSYTSENRQFLELQPSPKMSLDNDTKSQHFWHLLATDMNKYLFPNGTGPGTLDDEIFEEEEIDYVAQYPIYSTNLDDKSKSEEAYLRSIVVPNRKLNKPIVATNQANILPTGYATYDIVIEDLIAASGMWSDILYPNEGNRRKTLSETLSYVEGMDEDPLQESPLQAFIHRSDNAEDTCDRAMEAPANIEKLEDHHSIKLNCDQPNDYMFSQVPSDEKSSDKAEDGFCERAPKLQNVEEGPELQTKRLVSGLQPDEKGSMLHTEQKTPKLQTNEKSLDLKKDENDNTLNIAEKASKLLTNKRPSELLTDKKKASELLTDEKEVSEFSTDRKKASELLTDGVKASELLTDGVKASELLTDEKKASEFLNDEKKASEFLNDEKKASEFLTDENSPKLWTRERKSVVIASTMKPSEKSAAMNTFDSGSVKKCTGDKCEIESLTLDNKIPDYHTLNKEPQKHVVDNEKQTSDMNLDPSGVKIKNKHFDILEKDEVDLYTMITAGLMKAQVLLKGASEGDAKDMLSIVDKDNIQDIIATYGDSILQYLKDIKVSPEQIQQIKREQSKVLVEQSSVLIQEEKEIESLLLTPLVTKDKLYPNKKKINYGKLNLKFKREVEIPTLSSSEGEANM